MANAQVEKLKALGLRHGEKAVVALAGVLCLFFLFIFVTKKTIDLTPEQVAAAAKQAESSLSARQQRDDILKLLEDQGVKNPGFEKLVLAQEKESLAPVAFKPAKPWVTPEPGAGRIRDTPTLLAVTDLFAYPGRGGALVYDLDNEGKRKLDDKKNEDASTKARRTRKRNRRRRGMGGMMGRMMGGMMGGMAGGGMMGMGGAPPDSPEAKKELERKQKEIDRRLAGSAADADKEDEKAKEKEGAETVAQEGPFKEKTRGLRWVVITGVLDHKAMRANWLNALKNPAVAHPNYKQVDIQRKARQSDGTWPEEWEDVDLDKNRLITYNLPEEEEELTPDDLRLDALVDPLPFLKAGFWERVDVAKLVPKEKREIPKETAGAGGMMGRMMGGMMDGGAQSGGGMMGSAGMNRGMMSKMMGKMTGGGMMAGGGEMMGGMMGAGAMASSEENTDFPKSERDKVLVRALDFTVDPDTTYKFRVRVVVYNPNYKRSDVSPGTNTTEKELKGPWSAESAEVTMPADVATYAMAKTKPGVKRSDQVQFQVVRWNPEDGVTVTRTFDAGPGEVIGEPASTPIPNSDGEKMKNKLVDYNSRQLVLDTAGGPRPIAQVGASGAPLDVPAVSVVMRPDGTLVVRNEVNDLTDPIRKDMDETYKREVKETGKKRESSQGSMYGRMMGGGMMGAGGMMGGGRR